MQLHPNMAGNREKPRQACDSCRFRKVKCDRGQPCKNCHAGDLLCQYLYSIRRKGPKEGQGRRQSQLRRRLVDFGKSSFQTMTRDAAPLWFGGGSSRSPEGPTPASAQVITQHDAFNTALPLINHLPERPGQSRLLSVSLIAHIQLFLKVLFPIMPVINGDELLADAARLEELPPSRYALILALCAATRMQFGIDNAPIGEGPEVDIPLEPQLTGEMLIRLAETSLRQYNVIDDTTVDSMLASFFLFASYGNLNNPRHAWFYLNQSISLAQLLDITRETGYHDLPDMEREKRRRVFWLLFVTERTFALQHRRSVMLRSSITKPRTVDSDCPVVMNDFINHIRLFESLPWSLYEWQSPSDGNQLEDLSLVHTINDKLCTIQADQSVIPSQRFDTLITQQWLRVSMWRLAVGKKPLSSAYNFGVLLPPSLPIDAGKIIISALGSVGPKSKDCHGIGMEQKLFDVGVSLADSAMLPSWSCSSFETGPRDLLCAVIESLSTIRGCQSHLLPTLLKYSESVLGLTDPTPHIDFRLEMPQETETATPTAVVEDISAQVEEPVDSLTWLFGDELGMLDMSTPSPTWDDAGLSGEQVDTSIGLSLG
ncbi:Zn(2)-C6 fungal-type domain-containing protein [Fusarium sp. Ph1]|nr:Zn(2)-C6 fungal-type domain-containing protein [Fusarium sp. Ph1]